MIRVGTAGWTLPAPLRDSFPGDDSHLGRYGRVFAATEINSSFHRAHRKATYARWAASVPDDFRFSVKMPKTITHGHRLVGAHALLDAFLDEAGALGTRLGCLLVQLPPSFAFTNGAVEPFCMTLRERYSGDIALEPRHESWFDRDSSALLEHYHVARVAADPARVAHAAEPGGWRGIEYWRLHGSPRTYYSSYPEGFLDILAANLGRARRSGKAIWCIFDNTTLGAATANALALRARLDKHSARR